MKRNKWIPCIFALVALAALCLSVDLTAAAKSRVVLARNAKAINDRNQADAKETARLFDRALLALTGRKTAADSWKTLGLKPDDVVAVKINCNTWTIGLSPHPELMAALCNSLQTMVPANRIIVYDNDSESLIASGFAINRTSSGVRYTGTDQGDGFDAQERLSKIVTQTATKIINLASLKCADGDLVASLLLKNQIGSLLPEDMPKCHKDADFLAGVCARSSLKSKTILNMVSGLRGTYRRSVPWYWGGIIIGSDPLAVEMSAIGVINEKRAREKVDPLPVPEHVKIAEKKYALGTIDPAKIEQIKIDL
ncbi:MAG: hypothetical protein NTW95_12360 [Candidatus Aminicenantes bacterium]|nr:hypothetical protein [Candidatus Aminicenantes bacterium]